MTHTPRSLRALHQKQFFITNQSIIQSHGFELNITLFILFEYKAGFLVLGIFWEGV